MEKKEGVPKHPSGRAGNRLGTFGGVFTPSILTILGVILFMRAGFVVGQAGIYSAILILLISKSITALTSVSISAVSTNTPVAGGGAYFLISRALGPEFGGAIGIVLYCAQAVSVPFYIIGFTEALVRSFPAAKPYFVLISVTVTLLLFFIAYVGAKWAIKAQFGIMAVLALSIVAFAGGALQHFRWSLFIANRSSAFSGEGMSFWAVFAIYFPAVTGIMAGVNMSGDLKEPSRSIPLGTFAAVAVGFIIYFGQILIIGGAQTRTQLLSASFETMAGQALFGTGYLVEAGVFAATLSSAIGSFLGAPRVLQAVARDGVIPMLSPFARGEASSNEPHRALWLTLGGALVIIGWTALDTNGGAFNTLAAVVTMFFLYTYGMVNLAAFVESFAQNPSFRPRFRYYHWAPALIGALSCGATAFLIDPPAAVIAAFLVAILYLFLTHRVLRVRFGDARWGFTYSRLRANLFRLSKAPIHPKNWRPMLLVLTGNPETRMTMVMYALWIGEARGMVTLARVLVGELQQIAKFREAAVAQLEGFLRENDFEALSSVVITRSLDEGFNMLIQGHPVSPLRPNMVMMGWSSDPQRAESFTRHLRTVWLLGMSLVVIRDKGCPREGGQKRIDVWWRGRENGSLMVLLAHLITLNWNWLEAKIRLLRLIDDEAGRGPSAQALQDLLSQARVKADVQILVSTAPFAEILHRHSADASVVLLGFNVPEEGSAQAFQSHYDEVTRHLPTTLLIASSGQADLFA
jgi:amino acid transporter